MANIIIVEFCFKTLYVRFHFGKDLIKLLKLIILVVSTTEIVLDFLIQTGDEAMLFLTISIINFDVLSSDLKKNG